MMAEKIFIKLIDTSGSWWIPEQNISVTRYEVKEVTNSIIVKKGIKAGRAVIVSEKEYDAYLEDQIATNAENKAQNEQKRDERVRNNIEREENELKKRNEAIEKLKAEQVKRDEAKKVQEKAEEKDLEELDGLSTEEEIQEFIKKKKSEDVIDIARQKIVYIQSQDTDNEEEDESETDDVNGLGVGSPEDEQKVEDEVHNGEHEAGDVIEHKITKEDVVNNPDADLKVGKKVEIPVTEEVKTEEKAVNSSPVNEDDLLDRAGNKVEKKDSKAKKSGDSKGKDGKSKGTSKKTK